MATRSAKPPVFEVCRRETPKAMFSGMPSSVTAVRMANPETLLPTPPAERSSSSSAATKVAAPARSPIPESNTPPIVNDSSNRSKAIDGERGNERAAGKGQHRSNQPSRRPPVRSDDAPYHQGAGRYQAEEKGVQHRSVKEASLIYPHTVPASGIAAPQSRSCPVVEESSSATIETRLSTQLESTPRSCEISSVDIPERRRFSTSSSRQTSPLLSKTHASLQRLTRLFIPARRLAFRDTGARIFLLCASPRCTYLGANDITLRVRLSPAGRQEVMLTD